MITLLSEKTFRWIFFLIFTAFVLMPVALFPQSNDSIPETKKESKESNKKNIHFKNLIKLVELSFLTSLRLKKLLTGR